MSSWALVCASLVFGSSPGDVANEGDQDVVQYTLDVRLEPEPGLVRGKGTIVWRNVTHSPTSELWWHLYLNAFRNNLSTFMKESGGQLRGDEFDGSDWGWVEVTKLETRTGPAVDLLAKAKFEAPDDDNEHDRTVMRTFLPEPIGPGAELELEIEFVSKLPKVFARSGRAGDFFMVAQWFPKLAVYEPNPRGPFEPLSSITSTRTGAWNCHQYHATSEYYADYGTYEVSITVPERFEVGATGTRVSSEDNGDGTVTHLHRQEMVHDFAWTAHDRYLRSERTFVASEQVTAEDKQRASELLGVPASELELGDVKVILLLQPEHRDAEERYFNAVFQSLEFFGLRYGAYPYDVLTVVDPPRNARGAGGMEYPTLITGGYRWGAPETMPTPEGVTVHEFGHQYWYGLLGSNEFEESWLDEGINTYSTGKLVEKMFPTLTVTPQVFGWLVTPWVNLRTTEIDGQRARFFLEPDADQIVHPSWRFRTDVSYFVNSYSRPALTLRRLEQILGEETFARALRHYALKWRFRHPRTGDFIEAFEEIAQRPLRGFFLRAFAQPGAVDYRVVTFTSEEVDAPEGVLGVKFDPEGEPVVEEVLETERIAPEDIHVEPTAQGEESEDLSHETIVVIERRGEAARPVKLEVELEDGSVRTFDWEGHYRWRKFEFLGPQAVRASLYPEGDHLLDITPLDDGRRREGTKKPAVTWTAHVGYAIQTLVQLLGGLL